MGLCSELADGNEYLADILMLRWSAGGSAYVGSAPAALTATVAAGSTVSLNWTTWPDSHLVCGTSNSRQ